EITARTGKDPGLHYRELAEQFGEPFYTRIDAPATPEQKDRLKKLDPSAVKAAEMAGEPIVAKLTRRPGSGAAPGGLKGGTGARGWGGGGGGGRMSKRSTGRASSARLTSTPLSTRPSAS